MHVVHTMCILLRVVRRLSNWTIYTLTASTQLTHNYVQIWHMIVFAVHCCDSAGFIRFCGDDEGNCRRAALLTETAANVTRALEPAEVLANVRSAATAMPSHRADVRTQSRRPHVRVTGVIHILQATYPKPVPTSKAQPPRRL